MERSPSPSPFADSDPSRQGDTATTSSPQQPKHVQFQRQSESSPPQDNKAREWGGIKSSLDLKDNTLDEQSPLLPARGSEDVGHVPSLSTVMSPDDSSQGEAWNADAGKQEQSKSSWYLFLLTISIGG